MATVRRSVGAPAGDGAVWDSVSGEPVQESRKVSDGKARGSEEVVNVPDKQADSTLQVQSHEADRASSLHPSSSTTP